MSINYVEKSYDVVVVGGGLSGMCAAIAAARHGANTCIIQNRNALRDENKLKKLYVRRHDERSVQIYTLARNTAMQILLCMGLVATVIAGYFNVTVSITIFVCIWVSSSVSLLLTWYYSNKL